MNEVVYIIAIHGIGDQRYNETVLPVINGFAKAKNKNMLHDLVSIGMLNHQTGSIAEKGEEVKFARSVDQKLWAEFKGIPSDGRVPDSAFYGEEDNSGKNYRFVDMYWADILDADGKQSAQEVEPWTQALMGRNSRRDTENPSTSRKWLLKLLDLLQEIILFLNSFLSFKGKEMKEVIFNKYLADVQVYGEHLNVRGKAVSRFHLMMEKILEWHLKEEKILGSDRKPKFVFLAHSLGSVLTMDALCYAHVDHQKVKSPFASYQSITKEGEKSPTYDYAWTKHVDTLITLGSPIDKYIILWWQNYSYLNEQNLFSERSNKIRHINYSDEQDPVGHKLDVFRDTEAFKSLFEPINVGHEVYNRYSIPGKAHVDYWEDEALMQNIIKNISESQDEKTEEEKSYAVLDDEPNALLHAMTLSYFIVPFIGMLVMGYFFAGGFSGMLGGPCVNTDCINWTSVVANAIGFIASSYFFHKLIKIIVYWRMILRSKNLNQKKVFRSAGLRARVKFFRYLIWVVLVIAFYTFAHPEVLPFSSDGAMPIAKYLGLITVLYFGFLGLLKFFVPKTKIIASDKGHVAVIVSLVIFAVVYFASVWLKDLIPTDKYRCDSVFVATMLGVFVYLWTYACVILEMAKAEIGKLI